MEPGDLRITYLTGATVYLRAPVKADAEVAAAWLDDTFPVNTPRAENLLKDEYRTPRWSRPSLRLVIVRSAGDAVVGGVLIHSHDGYRRCDLELTASPWEDGESLRAEALGLLIPWLRDENEVMVVQALVAADQPETIRAAEAAGMVRNVRFRERFVRPGGRVDGFVYEALNPRWEVRDA